MTEELIVEVNGEPLVPDVSGALWWPGERALIFADIHFEKGSSYARRGALLPPYDTRATLERIAQAMERRTPRRVIALGDSFHDGEGASRLDDVELAFLARLTSRAQWLWIAGNHDPAPPPSLGGTVAEEAAIRGLVFRHEPGAFFQMGEIAGHLHPCTTITRRGRSLRRRCFVSDGTRMVLPAFGAYAGGLDLRDPAIASLFPQSFGAYALGQERVYAVKGARKSATECRSAAAPYWRAGRATKP